MFHRLFAGFFDADSVTTSRLLVVKRPLELEVVYRLADEFSLAGDEQIFNIGDDTMEIRDGYVDCPWLTPGVNRSAVDFMLRLNEETKCMFVDLGHGEVVDTDVLNESIGRKRT